MIIHDYECEICEEITEHLVNSDNVPVTQYCPVCNGVSHKIVSMSMTSPVDAAWISDVLEVVNKKSDGSHCKEFLRHPTRSNYKNWMKGEGLRPLEDGEKALPKHNREKKLTKIKKGMHKAFRERNKITVNTA